LLGRTGGSRLGGKRRCPSSEHRSHQKNGACAPVETLHS
jgi:hypothetical protein